MKMSYIIRRRIDDNYFSITNGCWKETIDKDCYLRKDQIDIFKKSYENNLNDYLIYIIMNPKGEK